MILERIEHPDGTVTFEVEGLRLAGVHPETTDCYKFGCVVHFPTATDVANEEGWPYNWRDDRQIMERICPHGAGHPDYDDANYQRRIGRVYETVHGCDGCCS